MLQNESRVKIVDNSGAKEGLIIRVMKGSSAKKAQTGDLVKIAIKSATPDAQVKEGEVALGLVVRLKKEMKRADGSYIKFGDNAVVLVQKDKKEGIKALGKRIFGPVDRVLRDRGYKNVANLAEEVI
ncbi:MAG TPA: 50S ribosomal protein L14 [Candidatus Absconditabacterales bacterium]|nr:50S ribosomal protein L14 [Candidatus Absconditabacterales bacterium]HMT27144.1 50S ribosomal protein L14 [Candidatus Absconditabacterales bacterium]